MAEENLQKALLEETIVNREIAEDTQGEISTLSDYFRSYFKDLRNDRLRQMEKDREGDRKGDASGLKSINDALGQLSGGERGIAAILGLIQAIPFAIAAFVAGAVKGIKDTLGLYRVLFLNTLGRLPIIRSLPKFFEAAFGGRFGIFTALRNTVSNITNSFSRTLSNFSKGFNLVGKETTAFGRTAVLAVKDFSTFAGRVGAFFGRLTAIGPSIKAATTSFVGGAKAVEGFKEIGKLFALFFSPILSLFGSTGSGGIVGNLAKGGGKFAKQAAGIAQAAGKIAAAFTGLFGAFGRFIFGPITIAIFTVIDFFKGFARQFNKYKDKGFLAGLFAGIIGGLGGIINGIIFLPLDLLKSAAAWVLEKLGATDAADKLRSFSFSDWWKGIIDKIVEGLGKVATVVANSIRDFFGFGEDDAESAPQGNRGRGRRPPPPKDYEFTGPKPSFMPYDVKDLNLDGTISRSERRKYNQMDLAEQRLAANAAKAKSAAEGLIVAPTIDASQNNKADVIVGSNSPAIDNNDRKKVKTARGYRYQ